MATSPLLIRRLIVTNLGMYFTQHLRKVTPYLFLLGYVSPAEAQTAGEQSPNISNTHGNVTIHYEQAESIKGFKDCPYTDIDSHASRTPKGDPAAVADFSKYILNAVLGTSDACRSSALRTFFNFSEASVAAYNKIHESQMASISVEDTADRHFKILQVAGWELGASEGSFYAQTDENWMRTTFGAIMPNDWREYFLQRSKELADEFTHDAFILIPFDDIRKRIIYWEEFLKRNPLFPLRDQVEYMIVNYMAVYLSGTDNSRIYEQATTPEKHNTPRPLRHEVRTSYLNFLAVNQDSKHYPLINDWFRAIRDNKFMATDEFIDAFVENHLTRGGLGIEFPRR